MRKATKSPSRDVGAAPSLRLEPRPSASAPAAEAAPAADPGDRLARARRLGHREPGHRETDHREEAAAAASRDPLPRETVRRAEDDEEETTARGNTGDSKPRLPLETYLERRRGGRY